MAKLVFLCLGLLLPAVFATVEDVDVASVNYLRERRATVDDLLAQYGTSEVELARFAKAPTPVSCSARSPPPSRNGILDQNKRWGSIGAGKYAVLVVFQNGYTQQERSIVLQSMKEIESKTCIRFWVYNTEAELKGQNYVLIKKTDGGCWAYLGNLRQGKQEMNLQQGSCIWKSVATHELIHVIGFEHAHMVPERDNYVTIMWDNIIENQKFNFNKLDGSKYSAYGAPYDYDSIMHYEKGAFSKNGRDTIVSKPPGKTFGVAEVMSHYDAYKINKMYNCQA